MLIVLLAVGGFGLAGAATSEEEPSLDDRLVWADVQRQFERAERRSSGQGDGGPVMAEQEGTPHDNGDPLRGGSRLSADPDRPDASSGDAPERDGPEP
jgi:hypothetical protein